MARPMEALGKRAFIWLSSRHWTRYWYPLTWRVANHACFSSHDVSGGDETDGTHRSGLVGRRSRGNSWSDEPGTRCGELPCGNGSFCCVVFLWVGGQPGADIVQRSVCCHVVWSTMASVVPGCVPGRRRHFFRPRVEIREETAKEGDRDEDEEEEEEEEREREEERKTERERERKGRNGRREGEMSAHFWAADKRRAAARKEKRRNLGRWKKEGKMPMRGLIFVAS